ncbi:cfap92 [Pungitius sinensis]
MMSETGPCNPASDCDADQVTDEGKEHVSVLQTHVVSMEPGLEQRSGSPEDITDDIAYYVTWTVCIALAFPRGKDIEAPEAPGKTENTNKAQSWYHIEYKLLPCDTETVKVDLMVFGPLAKLYIEDESKVVRTWRDGDQAWVGWSQQFKIRVNKDLLISLLPHTITLQIWNSTEKLSNQARYERMKAFRLTQDQPEDDTDTCGGIRSMVNNLRSCCRRTSNTSKKSTSDKLFDSHAEGGSEAEFQKPTIDSFNLEETKVNGVASAELRLIRLVAGETSVTQRFPVCSCGVVEVLCNVSLDSPLISDQMKAELNPLVITIVSATSMPSSPVPFHVLEEKCGPVYCQYKFHDLNMHKTNSQMRGTRVHFGDVHVILTGLMNPGELREFLSGPPLEIEVHDRDMKREERALTFGPGSVGEDSPTQNTAALDPFGVARLNLSELLLGRKRLKEHLPIKCCPPPPLADRERDGKTMPPGRYSEANSQLKVEVEICCPLHVQDDGCEGPFGRIVYLFDYNNLSLMTRLRSEILTINASALHLDSQQALSSHTMNFSPDESRDLDFVSGFHVLDKRAHVFVLEGLRHGAVRRLWEAVPLKQSGSEEEEVKVLYNSNLGFFKRIYGSLGVALSPISLYEPLETIMGRPRVYIRGMVPRPCFQALIRLSQLRRAERLTDVAQRDLFPSAAMILGLGKTCGTRAGQREQKGAANAAPAPPTRHAHVKCDAPSGVQNLERAKWKRNSRSVNQSRDFIQENVKTVHKESERLQKPKAAVFGKELLAAGPVHNYSIQTFNSSERAKELLREVMAQAPGRRFTYCQRYHSATVEQGHGPFRKRTDSVAAPAVGFTSRNSESKLHPRHPDEARVEELRKPWRENVLHDNILKPPLSRDTWTWSQRHRDFQLHFKPLQFFSTPPSTIHLAGDLLKQEQLEAAAAQNPPGTAPLPRFMCHMAGNSDRIQEILKDEPKKYSLRKPGMVLEPLPQLSVMNLSENNRRGFGPFWMDAKKKGAAPDVSLCPASTTTLWTP